MLSPAIMRELKTVDWDFPKASNDLIRSPHWYPGTFPPELPSTLIQATTDPGDFVFDPYGGVGTTTTEALRLRRRAWCVELNRIGGLTAYVTGMVLLIRLHHPELLDNLIGALARTISAAEESVLFPESQSIANSREIDIIVGKLVSPEPERFLDQLLMSPGPNNEALSAWYHGNTLQQIVKFTEALSGQECVTLRLFGLMALSANLKALSSQTRSWGHIADNVKPKELVDKELAVTLRRWLGRFCNSLEKTNLQLGTYTIDPQTPYLHVAIHNWMVTDPLTFKPAQSAMALITSPPYGGAIDYILSQRLSHYLLGADENALLAEQRKEVGARRRRFSDKSRDTWAQSLCVCVKRQLRYLDRDGTLVLIMPHKSEGRANGNDFVDDALKSLCWIKLFSIDRSIRSQRTRQAWTSIKRETISIYRRHGDTGPEGA